MKRTIVLTLTLGLIVLLAMQAYAYDDGDFQIWDTDSEEFKINKSLKAIFEQEFRWGDNASDFFYQHYDGGLSYAVNSHWNVGGGFRYILTKSKTTWRAENAPYLSTAIFGEFGGWKIEDRSRLEYQNFDYKADTGRYRNKLTVKLPFKFTKYEIQPYVSDEIFIQFVRTDPFNQNRFSSGLGMNLTKSIKSEIYYMLLSAKGATGWTDANVLGVKVKISF